MSLKTKMRNIFTAVQANRTCHQNYVKKMRKYYDKVDLEQFLDVFIACLKIPLTFIEKHPNVENNLTFAAKFAISLQPQSENEEEYEEMCPFLEKLFDFLLEYHNAREVSVRFRICYFLNMILDTMGDNATIDDELCNKILQCMMDRIVDKSPKVRAQAAIALHRLQEPNNKACPVINVYLFHLAKDPSAEVRRVILAKMAKNKMTLHAAIKKTRDVDDSVRKMAYLFISKITVKSLTISQREQLINNGLQDRTENIKKCVKEILIPSWFRYYDKNFINFLKAIDVENSGETASLALECLFKNAEIGTLIEQLPIDNTKFIPLEQLSSEIVMYWRCLAKFLKTENFTDEFEQIMPELSPFCTYIKNFINLFETRTSKLELITNQFILYQLFEMVKMYDLADEMGRKNLKNLILETLQSHQCSEKISECIVKYFENVVPDVPDRIALLVEVINEIRIPTKASVPTIIPITEDERHEKKLQIAKLRIKLLELEDEEYSAIQRRDYGRAEMMKQKIDILREEIKELEEPAAPQIIESQAPCEEKNDPETIMQCLQIMYYMMQSRAIITLSPTLRTLMESIALPQISLHNTHNTLLSLALKCLGLCCHVDKDLAKKYLMMYFLYISESADENVWIAGTQVIFDLLLKYGIEHFEIMQEDPQDNSKKSKSVRLYSHNDEDTNVSDKHINCTDISNNVIKALIALLDNQVQNLQSVATEGLCKLILHKRISSHQLISQLLILWHNPLTKENPFLSQCLCQFFNCYISKIPESQAILEEAYLPTLKMLATAPEMSPFVEIDALRISEVIIKLTCCAIHNNYGVHNQLTYTILSEILNPDTEIELDVLIKSLRMLDVQLDGENLKNDILKALDDVEDMLHQTKKKTLLNYIYQFRAKITAPPLEQTGQENPENPENPENENNQENQENPENQEDQDAMEDENENDTEENTSR